jgi:hypothetical protein
MKVGRRKQGIISWNRMVATVKACLLEVGKASTHPEKCLPELGDICVV